MVYYAFRFGTLRAFSTVFYFFMCFSAVYLNHHYILDVIWGSVYAIGTAFTVDQYWNWSLKRRGVIVPGPDPEPAPPAGVAA
jgi:membrane-associated phospholipid phosphatase